MAGTARRVIGLFGGIGTMLHEARALGFEVVGNVDPRARKHYPLEPWLWETNFPDVPLYTGGARYDRLGADLDGVRGDKDFHRVDLALGHPPCGGHSSLGHAGSHGLSVEERARRGGEYLATFARLVRITKPRLFAMENLPKVLRTVAPETWWREELKRYHLTFIRIANWDYGCVQRRERLWVIGARRGLVEPFRFRPIKRRPTDAPSGVLDALAGLGRRDVPELAHVHERADDRPYDSYWVGRDEKRRQVLTVGELAARLLKRPVGRAWRYQTADGRIIRKPGHRRLRPEGTASTLTAGPGLFHPETGWPLTPRERARLMGFPDEFALTDGRPVDRTLRYKLATLTGRAVPSEFVRYLLPQLRDHLDSAA